MKKLFFSAALVAASFASFAQDDAAKALTFGVGVDVAMPIGKFGKNTEEKFSDLYSLGIGGSVQAKYALDEQLGITLSLGYMSYMPKTIEGEKVPSFSAIPILAGIEYNFTEQIFASAQIGYTIYGGKLLSDDDVKLAGLSYAPGIGFRFAENFSALLKYQGTSATLKAGDFKETGNNISQIGLRLAYNF